jgi:guanylate kinase
MTNPLYLFVGPSGSGKTTIVDELECKYRYKCLQSYTTRPQRYENEYGHIFISDDEFDNLENIVAYTEYHGHRYCATEELLNNSDMYVVDCDGVETLLNKYSNTERLICVFYFDTTVSTRIARMLDRGDSDMQIVSRLYNDEQFDWYDKLNKLVWDSSKLHDRNVELYKINANNNKDNVLELVLYFMNKVEEGE